MILNDVTGNRLGMGTMGVVDDEGDGLVTSDGGEEIMDHESKWSDETSMSAIVVIRDESGGVCKGECV